jgi:hypothetical protein
LNKIRWDDMRLMNREGYGRGEPAIQYFKVVSPHVPGEVEVNHGKPRLGEPMFTVLGSRMPSELRSELMELSQPVRLIFWLLFFLFYVLFVKPVLFVFTFLSCSLPVFSSSSAYSSGIGSLTTTGTTFIYS